MKRETLWKFGRIGVAVGLLVVLFLVFIKPYDTVTLRDGAQVKGAIANWPDTEGGYWPEGIKIVRGDGTAETIPVDNVAFSITPGAGTRSLKIEHGIVPLVRQMDYRWFTAGLFILAIVPLVASWRWQMLLAAQGIRITYWLAMELTLVGLFFNNFMPGLTGGDFIKAYYVSKLTKEKKTHAVVTVFLDRIIGMVALGIIASLALIFGFLTHTVVGSEYRLAGYIVAVFMAAVTAGGAAFYSTHFRKIARDTVRATPGYGKVRALNITGKIVSLARRADEAVFLYRSKKAVLINTTLISFIAHASAILAIYFFGQALGIHKGVGLIHFFIIVPVCFIVSSVPITPAGWGVGEAVFVIFFKLVGVSQTLAITMSVIYRFTQAVWTLPGGAMLMFQRERPTIEEAEREMEEAAVEGEDVAS